jgi:hypothetical protein
MHAEAEERRTAASTIERALGAKLGMDRMPTAIITFTSARGEGGHGRDGEENAGKREEHIH